MFPQFRPLEALEPRRLLSADFTDPLTPAERADLVASADRYVPGGFAATVNFQPDDLGPVAFTRGDFGRPFNDRGNGLTYGWNRDLDAAGDVLDRDTTRDHVYLRTGASNAPPGEDPTVDQRYDTVARAQPGDTWSIEVPEDGTYAVLLAAGDPDLTEAEGGFDYSRTSVSVNGEPLIDARIFPDWPFAEATGYYESENGRITLSVNAESVDPRLLYVRVARVVPVPDAAAGERLEWRQEGEDLPDTVVRRAEGGGGIVGDEYVYVGGFTQAYAGVWDRADAVDLVGGDSRGLAAPPDAAAETHAATTVHDGLLYWLGGEAGLEGEVLASAWTLDPAANTWTRLADLPAPRTAANAVVVGDTLHLIGGAGEDRVVARTEHYSLDLADPTADWRLRTELPFAVAHAATVTDGDRLYVLGGERDHGVGYDVLHHLQTLDLTTGRWSLDTIPIAVSHHNAVYDAAKDSIYVAGGHTHAATVIDDVLRYDVASGDWRRLTSMPQNRKIGALFVREGDGDRDRELIYLAGDAAEFGLQANSIAAVI